MPNHKVTLSLPELPVVNRKCTFDVYEDNIKLGTFQISRGGLRWTSANHQYEKFKTWTKLKEFFED